MTFDESCRLFDGDGDGLCERELLDFCRREERAELPRGENLVTLVAMGFEVGRPERIAAAFGRDPSFALTGLRPNGLELDWAPDGRAGEVRGSVVIVGARVRADSVSLHHAGSLCARLKRLADGELKLLALERRTVKDLLRSRAFEQAG